MRLRRRTILATISVLAATPLSVVARGATGPATEARLGMLADLLLPARSTTALITQSCRVAYRTKLTTNPADRALEADLPGVHERMIAAAGGYCDAQTPIQFRLQQDRIKADWRDAADTPELIAFLAAIMPISEPAEVTVRPGEMASDAARRNLPSDAVLRAFEAKQRAFATTPPRVRLLARLADYQRLLTDERRGAAWVTTLLRSALSRAREAANVYARSRGMSEPYAR